MEVVHLWSPVGLDGVHAGLECRIQYRWRRQDVADLNRLPPSSRQSIVIVRKLTNECHLGDPKGSPDDVGGREGQLREHVVVGAVAGHHLWNSQMRNIETVGLSMTIVRDHLFVGST